MKHYLLSVVTPADGVPPEPAEMERIMRNVEEFHRELQQAGARVFDGGLSAPGTATVVRAEDGGTVLTDGPYTEGKEYLGGLSIIKAPDPDAALDWGRKAALAIGLPIEVRPFEGEAEA
ncbi:YciI family protein [Streptomyces sp. NPDC059818]|uniref:YciI family protein n=1 Tax=Streptomyces sp. NPDC059818 TaxID=3346962 RepID=UPI003669125B